MAIQKHNTYYDPKKPNEGITYYDENGNHKEVLTRNDLNAISSISSINDKVTALSAKTVTQIKSTDTVTATPHTATDGTIYYELEAAPEVSDTVIYGINGISSTHEGTVWTIGLSSDFLSANALNSLSGNWQDTYNSVKSNSSNWNEVSSKVNSADFIPVKNDVEALKENSAHYPVESTNDFISVNSADHKFTLTFNSGNLATEPWVEEQLKNFGGFTTANPGPSGEPAVDEPSTKLIYLVPDDTVSGKDKYSEWIYGTNSAWICIGETSIDLSPLYELSANFNLHNEDEIRHITSLERTNWNEVSSKLDKSAFNSWSAQTENWDITEYSGGFGIDVSNHTITLTENYLSANALDNLSGKWEKASDTLIASSGKWNDTYETVSANSARWDKVDEKLDTSVFEAYTATADDIQYSGKNGIAIENHEVWISADYLSANALKDLSGKWENASDVVIADSAKWNSAYSAITSANLWNVTYERVQASADEWDKVVNKQDKLLFGYDEDNAISSINGSALAGAGGVTGDYYSASNPSGFINADQAEAQIIAKKYITSSVSELDNFYSKAQTSGANEIANAIKDFVTEDLLEATSGELETWVSTNYYDKTETSSKTEIENAFDNIPKYILNGDSNITATSAQDGKNIRWDLAVNATPVVTDTTLTGDKGIYTHKTSNSGEWCVELVQSAYDAINEVQNKLDTTVAAQTYQPKGNYVSSTEITDMATKTWVSEQGYLTAVPSEYVTDTELQTTLGDYATNTLVQNTSAEITAMIPSTTGLASETDLQIVSAGVDYVSAHAITAHQSLTDYYTKSETSGATELSTEFAKYTKTEDLHIPTKVSDLTDSATYVTETELEVVSGEITELIPTNYVTSGDEVSGNKQYTLTTAGWEEIPIEWDLTGRNFAIGVENEFVESGSPTDILLQGYQNSGTYVDFAQGYQNSAFQYVISQGYQNKANYESIAQGYINTAINIALAQGSTNSANYQAFAQGILNKAKYDSLAQGHSNSAVDQSIAQGLENTAYHYSFAQGFNNKADMKSFAQGADNRASYYSQTIGHNLIASGFDEDDYYYGLFAIGGYNATTSNALFVVGNGSSYNGTPTRSDAFVIYRDGSVSAKGDISANGVKLGAGGGSLTLPVNVGTGNNVSQTSAIGAIGNNCSAGTKSFAFSYKGATASNNSFAVNDDNVADHNSFAWGWANTADNYSIAGGNATSADEHSFALGNAVYTKYWTLGVGRGLEFSGDSNSNTGIGALVAGGWNKTTSNAIFVLGNGTGNGSYRRDAVVVDRSGNTKIYGSLTVDVSSGNNVLAVASAATLFGASRQTSAHYGVDNTAIGTTWVGVDGNGMHQGFIKYTDGGDVGALDTTSTIQINIKPENAGYNGEMTLTNVNGSTTAQSKVVNVPTASYSNMSSFDNTNGPNYMLRKTASGFDIGAAVINVTSLPSTTEANAYYFVYDV